LDNLKPLAVAIDPLDGSSNIDTNVSIGTIFSVLSAHPRGPSGPIDAFLQPGSAQLAAGFVIYGPQTALVLALAGVEVFILDQTTAEFVRVIDSPTIARQANEYAINASNYRYWSAPIRNYIDDCLRGEEGPLSKNFNMRWIASLVAEAYRILVRGGVFLYPGDRRKGYDAGRLRLVYEANPIAFIIEHAGGVATNGTQRLLDLRPSSVHQRTPLIFGAADEVDRVACYHSNNFSTRQSPLFSPATFLSA
jgi:fructose-1,6-bisphosphatase I